MVITDMPAGIGMCHHIRATDGEKDIGDAIIMTEKNGFAEAGEDNHYAASEIKYKGLIVSKQSNQRPAVVAGFFMTFSTA